jgi:hypothetical protein
MGATGFTIFTLDWDAAWSRAPALSAPLRETAVRCGEQIRRGWTVVEPLAAAVGEATGSHVSDDADADAVLTLFVEGEVVDLFRVLAAGWADGVLDRRMHVPDDLDGDLSLLRRFLVMAELASGSPEVGPEIRAALRGHVPVLLRWCDEAAPIVRRFAAALPA